MTAGSDVWNRLADAVEYPIDGWMARLARGENRAGAVGFVDDALDAFRREAAPLSLEALQQAYVEAFDLDPDSTLDIGWHLFGDGPDRGAFLVFVRQALQRAGVAEAGELPDYLGYLLRLVGREPEADAADLAALIAPAVERVSGVVARRGSPYRHVLLAAHRLLVEASVREEVQP